MSEITQTTSEGNGSERLLNEVRGILGNARATALRAVNDAMVTAYWEVGRATVEEEQQGKDRADYGAYLVNNLSARLQTEFGKGFNRSNVWGMRQLYLTFPILHALRGELTWTHYRLLMRVENPDARAYYEKREIIERERRLATPEGEQA
jgi:hypothetical protein